jgi:ABC-type transporter Mla subunit MlaD
MASKGKGKLNKRAAKELRAMRKRLDSTLAQAKRTEKQVAKLYAQQRQNLRARQAQAKAALARLRRQSAAAAPALKSGVQRAWSDLNSAVREAAARFRKTA